MFAQTGVTAELVLCADDELDYGSLLPADLRARPRLTLCRTPAPRSGPSVARNIAYGHARADIIACLDADDAYGPERLARLLPLVERHGVATGPTREIDARTQATRMARPRRGGDRLPIEDICELRMPFSPVYQKAKCPLGWPEIEFAEDVILNVDLYCAAGAYPFVEGADYIYHVSRGSRTHSESALKRARAGYLQILDLVDKRAWPEPVRDLVRRVFNEDLAAVERAQAAGSAGATLARCRARRRARSTRASLTDATAASRSSFSEITDNPPAVSGRPDTARRSESRQRSWSHNAVAIDPPEAVAARRAHGVDSAAGRSYGDRDAVKQLPARRWGDRAGKPGAVQMHGPSARRPAPGPCSTDSLQRAGARATRRLRASG